MDRLHPEYVEAARYLYNRINFEKTSDRPYDQQNYRLARMEVLLETLGSPQLSAPVIHVAGTKGKGSVCWQIAEILRNSGYSVGLYTSPHLEFIEERFVLNGQMVSPQVLVDTINELRLRLRNWDESSYGSPTFFELTTAIAWLIFKNAKTDVNVIEVGMGGRLDSTNVCQSLISVITPISFDHQDHLGDTIAKIATEKAGIIKPNSHVVVGARHPDALQVIRDIAESRKCNSLIADQDFKTVFDDAAQHTASNTSRIERSFSFEAVPSGSSALGSLSNSECQAKTDSTEPQLQSIANVKLRMLGKHQAENASIAIAVVQKLQHLGWSISEPTIRKTLGCTQVPSRIEVLQEKPTIIVDSAHNVASMTALVESLQNDFSHRLRTFIFASSKDKDYESMLDILLPAADKLIVTQFGSNPRHLQVEKLEESVREKSTRFPTVQVYSAATIAQATEYALRVTEANGLICYTGSFFMTAEVKQSLQEQSLDA